MKKFLLILMTCALALGLYAQIPAGDAQPCPGTPIVKDHEGNVYNTVKIGNQCWTKENLRTTTSPSTGTYLILVVDTGWNYTGKQARWYDNDPATYAPLNYGLLYNWNAAVDTFNTAYGETSVNTDYNNAVSVTFSGYRRGICPQGWHLPSHDEWMTLTSYVGGQSEYQCGESSSDIAKALASEIGWNSYSFSSACSPGDQSETANNATGFSAVPAGLGYLEFEQAGYCAFFWSATQNRSRYAYGYALTYHHAYVSEGDLYNGKGEGRSVRCLRNPGPFVTTGSVLGVTSTTATCSGEVVSDGGASVTARGVCWSTNHNPTIADAHTSNGTGVGTFTSSLTGLTPGTTYYVRAYATNSEGTAYGEEKSFVTKNPPCPGIPTVTDHEGNVYNTVRIGNQCWMKENLRTTTSPSTGTYLIPSAGTGNTYTGKQARWYNDDSTTYAPMNYGLLYNWNAAVDTFNTAYGETSVTTSGSNFVSVTFSGHRRGICPVGWHLPSDAEWTQLENYVGSQSYYTCDGNSSYIARALASETGWDSAYDNCTIGSNDPGLNNATGFSAVPAGHRYGSFVDAGHNALFWSSSQYPGYAHQAYNRDLYYNNADVYQYHSNKHEGISVRCLRDPGPFVTTGAALGVTTTTATCGGEVIDDGGFNVTARGICWSTHHNPTVADAHTSNGTGIGSFTNSITGLTQGTTYYVRAYATTSEGTTYGIEKSFTTHNPPCPGVPTVTDHEGNVYNTVQIGNQCWMKENLRTTTSPSTGTYLLSVSYDSYTYTGKQAYWINNDSATYAPMNYGLLYNWNAAVDTFNTAYGELSVNDDFSISMSMTFNGLRRGICPAGWHLPSDAEWNTMERTVCGLDWQTSYETMIGDRGSHAGKLAGGDSWNNSTIATAPGDMSYADRNASGFSAVPAGFYFVYNFVGDAVSFWSSTQSDSRRAYTRDLYSQNVGVGRGNSYKTFCFSVRCLRDPIPVVNTGSVLGVTSTTATCGGEVLDGGGASVTARGVCWSTSHNPTVADAHTSNGTGIGEFTGSITGLTPGTTYYVRAYATNSMGTAYGEEVSFTTNLCAPEDQCELTFVLTDSYGDGWNGNAILVKDGQTGVLLGYMTNEDMDGLFEPGETTTMPLAVCNGRTVYFEWVEGSWPQETSYTVYDGNGEEIFSGSGGFTGPISYTVSCASPCPAITLPYTENFDGYTTSTTAATGTEPTCWELVQSDVQMTDANRPQLYYKSDYAHSGKYSLLLNYRGVYAMPELSDEIPLNQVKLEMYLRQPKSYYALQVGVWEDNGGFVPVATFNNSGTGLEFVECDFSDYNGNGRRIAFRNISGDNTVRNYSYNYIDDINLTNNCEPITLPYTEDFDSYTASTTAATGVEPNCWNLVQPDVQMTDANRPQLYYKSSYAHSGNYSLLLNYRGVYAMPELSSETQIPINRVKLEMYVRQPKAYYQLEVGVWNGQMFVPVQRINNSTTEVEKVTVDFSGFEGWGNTIAFRNVLADGYSYNYSYNYIDDITLTEIPEQVCGIIELPYSENFDGYTQSTTAETGVQPNCWEVTHEDVALTNATKPQVYYNATYATSGSYTLRMKNRCVYALPELRTNDPVSNLTMTFKLRQPKTVYRLQVGVVDAQGNFTSVKTINNSSTNTEEITVDFANYMGTGRRIAFRNTVSSSSTLDYSVNYIDDITLDITPAACGIFELPYTENFDDYTQSTTAETGVQPRCWEVTHEDVALTNATKPQVYYNATYATSGSYTLRMKNRCVYALPELNVDQSVNELTMTFKLRQPKTVYRLQVGVVDAQGNFTSVKTINNSSTNTEDITVDFANYTGNGRRIAFRNTVSSSSTLEYSVNYIDDIMLDITPAACGIFELPYSENFDDYTASTTAETGVQPRCWEVTHEDVALTNATKPQVYYNATYATSGSYTLRMKNRCVYALPELNVDQSVNELTMTFKLRQPKTVYRLQVGVVDAQGNFTSVKTINNSSTNTEDITVDFANYTGNGRRIAFRNTVSSSSTLDYSVNYIDDITLDYTPAECGIFGLPYSENFDSYTQSVTAETGVQPRCWEVVSEDVSLTNATKPQVYYNATYATSGSYTLRMKNRCVYAMPDLNTNDRVSDLTMTFSLRQPKAIYRLQVGVVDAQGNFTSVKTINNSSTNTEDITVDFANYTGNGRRIAFRNTVSSSSTLDYSVNYIDDIVLVRTANNKSGEVTDATAVDALAADRDQVDVVVYPNPTKDVVNVQCTMNNAQCSGIEIVDVYGKIITTVGTRFIASADSPASAQSPVQINVSGLAAGMYFVRVTTDRGVVTKPFVKR